MSCDNCYDVKFGGSANCEKCMEKQQEAIISFLNSNEDVDYVISTFGVKDKTTGVDNGVHLTLMNYLLNDVKDKDGNFPKYDKQYWEMVKVLEDFANDVRRFQKQSDVENDVVRVCENLWEISVGCSNCI
jgi:hypothetical protein